MSHRRKFSKKWTVPAVVVGGAALTAGGLQLADADTGSSHREAGPSAVSAAFADAEHLSVKEARERLSNQGKLVTRAKKIDKALRPGWSAGQYIDPKSGKLTVNVISKQHAVNIDAPDTATHVVGRSTDDLNAVKKSVDRLQERYTPRNAAYYVDVRKNVVHVDVSRNTLNKGKTREFVAAVRKLGSAVHLDTDGKGFSPQYGMQDGDKITNTQLTACSLGWWVKDKSGADLLMTAGHCTKEKSLWYHKGLHIGGKVNNNYGPKDWGTIHVDDIASPRPTTGVDLKHDDKTAKISGHGKAPVGTEVCKSGEKTGQTCGPITAHDATVTYSNGTKLEGMSKAKYVSDHGDSGGPVYQMDPDKDDHVIAQGIVSGGPSGQDSDEENYYQPIGSALTDGDLTFIKSTD